MNNKKKEAFEMANAVKETVFRVRVVIKLVHNRYSNNSGRKITKQKKEKKGKDSVNVRIEAIMLK